MTSISGSRLTPAPRSLGALAVAALVAPALVSAQASPTARSASRQPELQSPRVDDRSPVAAARAERSALDRLKQVPLAPRGRAHLTVAGQVRVRGEGVSHFMLGLADDRSDVYGGSRTLLSADLHVAPPTGGTLRVFGEVRHAVSYSRDLPGKARPSDEDRADVQSLFGELGLGDATRVVVRVGRQELSHGKERIVGVSDWANGRRAFDGVSLGLRKGGLGADAFWTRPVAVRQRQRNLADSLTQFWGVTVGAPAKAPRTWQLYALGLAQERASFAGVTGAHRRVTVGGRAAALALDHAAWRLSLEVEGAWQTGRLADRSVRAGFVASEATGAFPRLPLAPTLAVAYDVSTGDGDPADGRVGTFHQLFPSAHSHGGYADVVGRQNAAERRAVATANLTARLQARVAAHHFARTSLADGAYTKAGTLLRAASGSRARDVGTEFDATATYTVSRYLRLLGGYGHFAPGAFLRAAPELAHKVDWGFAGTTFTF